MWGRLGAGALLLALALTGCSGRALPPEAARATPQEILAGCCQGALPYPDWAIALAEANRDLLRRLGLIQLRPGRMTTRPEATALLQDSLQPLDVLFFHSHNRMSGLLIPGHFTHGAIYLGTEPQLRAAGLWHAPELAPFHPLIRQGNLFLEAVDGGVRLAPAGVVLDTDAVVALRPRGQDRAAALRRGLGQMGTPFDMRFDATDPAALFCAELIALMFAGADLPRTQVAGRETIVIDAVVAATLTGELPFSLVGYVEATPGGGARVSSGQDLAWDMRQNWPR